ncbi:hypothetical protein AAVH_20758 [Aphelenchoides avenae]|nr:hypothetical protein AAVH_20758 [Aphelenchus avenae]
MNSSQALLIRLCIELPLVFIWFSVLCCVIRQVLRKGSGFATGFFKLYIAQSIVDISAYTSFIVAFEFDMLKWLPSWLSAGVGQQILFGFTGYVEYQHYALRLLMTANRFLTFGTQDFHKVRPTLSA